MRRRFLEKKQVVCGVMLSALACLLVVWWRPPLRRPRVVRSKGIKFLVSGRTVLGAQVEEFPEEPVFYGWVVQEAAFDVFQPQKALVIGVGAGYLTSTFRRRGAAVRAVELDPTVAALAEKEFGVHGIEVADGRDVLRQKGHRYDLVAIDCFNGRGASFFLFEEPDLLEALTASTDNFVLNFVLVPQDERDVVATLKRRLPYPCRAFRDNPFVGDSVVSNVVFFCSKGKKDMDFSSSSSSSSSDAPPLPVVNSSEWVRESFPSWEVTTAEGEEPPVLLREWSFYERRAAVQVEKITNEFVFPSAGGGRASSSLLTLFTLLVVTSYLFFMAATDKYKRSPETVGPAWLANLVRRASSFMMGNVLGIRWSMELDLTSFLKKKEGALVCVSPHGAYPVTSVFCAMPALRCDYAGEEEIKVRVAAASILFYVPVLREYLLLFGGRDASKETIERLVTNACVVAVNPGGVREMVLQRSDKEVVYVQANLGLFKLAVRFKTPLIIIYAFGENQMFTSYPQRFLQLRSFLADSLRVGLPYVSGRFGLSLGVFPVVPHPGTCTHVGADKFVAVFDDDDDAVALYHRYAKALIALFDAHKDRLLPPDVARKGLDVVWIGHPDDSYLSHSSPPPPPRRRTRD